jgi:hypothetical protein
VRAIKTSIISILAIGLLAGSAVGVAAQEEEADPMAAAKVTGTIGEGGDLTQEPTENVVDGVLEVRGVVLEGDWPIEMDDPRVTGSISVAINEDVHKVSDFEDVVARTLELRIENEAGSWTGQGAGVVHGGATIPQDEALNLDTHLLTGAGAYEGLSAYLIVDVTEDPMTVEGVIFAGEMPPFPELPVE